MKRTKNVRKKLIAALDKVFSLYIRRKTQLSVGGCFFCYYGKGKIAPIDHAFHFIRRGHHVTRWLEVNVVGSCRGCNYDMNIRPERYWQIFRLKFGAETEDALIAQSRQIAKFSREDLKIMIADFTVKLEAFNA